jgi:hypothetical protein
MKNNNEIVMTAQVVKDITTKWQTKWQSGDFTDAKRGLELINQALKNQILAESQLHYGQDNNNYNTYSQDKLSSLLKLVHIYQHQSDHINGRKALPMKVIQQVANAYAMLSDTFEDFVAKGLAANILGQIRCDFDHSGCEYSIRQEKYISEQMCDGLYIDLRELGEIVALHQY